MTLSDLRLTTAMMIRMCEEVANGGPDEQLIKELRSDPFIEHLPTGFGPEVAYWMNTARTSATLFSTGARKGDGLLAYNARLSDLGYSLDRLAAALAVVKP